MAISGTEALMSFVLRSSRIAIALATIWVASAIAQQQSPPAVVVLQPNKPAIAQPQNAPPGLIIPPIAREAGCGPGQVDRDKLVILGNRLRYVLYSAERAALQRQIDNIGTAPCANSRMAAFFVNLLSNRHIALARAD